MLFVTGGDPDLDQLPAILLALEEGGADVLEVGIPFSDPIADGPTIQASSQRALDRGSTPGAVLDGVRAYRDHGGTLPVVLMGYLNPMLRRGLAEFARDAAAAGADGAIVSDLTPEESDAWCAACREAGLDTVFLAAPTSTDDRLDAVARRSTGFVYAVSRTGVTGASDRLSEAAKALVERLRPRTDLPVCVGFGISRPEHVREVCDVAQGAVVGSWLVDLLAHRWNGGAGRQDIVEHIARMKSATGTLV